MKSLRIIAVLVAALVICAISPAQQRRSGMPFNYGVKDQLQGSTTERLRQLVVLRPELKPVYDDYFGTPGWNDPGVLTEIGRKRLERGQRFPNSYIDRSGRPFNCSTTAKGGEVIVAVQCSVSQSITYVKDDCLNPNNRNPRLPFVPGDVDQTTNVNQAIDLRIDIDVEANAEARSDARSFARGGDARAIVNMFPQPREPRDRVLSTTRSDWISFGTFGYLPQARTKNVNKNIQWQNQWQDQKTAVAIANAIAIALGLGG